MTATALETKQYPWWLHLMGGILNIIIGLLLLTTPIKTVILLVLALGIYFLVSGIFTLVGMFVDHSAWGWKLFIGVVSILAGLVVLRHPLISAVEVPMIIVLVLGVQGLITGIMLLALAFKGGGWGSGIMGALSVLFGIILILNFTNLGYVVALVWVTAVFALVGGIIQIYQAFKQRKD
jgi:uncharacterized membrane protein HdeD (DUF308 family)